MAKLKEILNITESNTKISIWVSSEAVWDYSEEYNTLLFDKKFVHQYYSENINVVYGDYEVIGIETNLDPATLVVTLCIYIYNDIKGDINSKIKNSDNCNETKPDDECCTETNKSLKDDYNVYGSKLTDVEEIKKLRAKCGKLTTLVGQLTYELFEEKLDDIIKEKILDERKDN